MGQLTRLELASRIQDWGITWANTPQGLIYWEGIVAHLRDPKTTVKIPNISRGAFKVPGSKVTCANVRTVAAGLKALGLCGPAREALSLIGEFGPSSDNKLLLCPKPN